MDSSQSEILAATSGRNVFSPKVVKLTECGPGAAGAIFS